MHVLGRYLIRIRSLAGLGLGLLSPMVGYAAVAVDARFEALVGVVLAYAWVQKKFSIRRFQIERRRQGAPRIVLDYDPGDAVVQIGNDGVDVEPLSASDRRRRRPRWTGETPYRSGLLTGGTKHTSAERIGERKDLGRHADRKGLWPGFESLLRCRGTRIKLIRPAMSAAVARLRDKPSTTSAADV